MMVAMNVDDNDARQRALLLHYAGEQVYDIFETLTDTGESDDFDKACEKLTAYFSPKKSIEYEVYVFRKEKQEIGETLDTYHTRLRRLAATCDFTDIDREIKTQIVQNCSSCRLRRRALRDADFSLSAMLAEGRAIELSEKQATDIENIREAEVNIASKRFQKTTTQRSQFKKATSNSRVNRENSTCYCCGGKYPHRQNKPCAAKGKICNYCQKSGHFAKVCKAKMHNNSMQTNCVTNINAVTTTNVTSDSVTNTNAVTSNAVTTINAPSDSDDGYVFSAKNEAIVHNSLPTCVVQIEGESIRMTIDSGASVNIMDSNTFNKIRRPSNMLFKQPVSNVYPYGSRTPLPVIGVFITKVKFHSKVVDTHVHVVEGTTGNLLGCQTAQDLGILHITQNVTARQYVTTSDTPQSQIIDQFADLFEGAGKVDGVEIKLHIDQDVSPKEQQHRRIPFHIRLDVENELDRLDKLYIIERVDGPTPWVSPIVVVPKKSGDVRICVDTREANKAVQRIKHVMPTIDELITDLNGACVFSTLDLKSAYHQLELNPESRYITTFTTHVGLWRYKRLMFGINAASEIFQNTLSELLSGLDGCKNMSDDIIVYSKTQQEHDKCMKAVLERLRQKNVKLNKDKCMISQNHVCFYGRWHCRRPE